MSTIYVKPKLMRSPKIRPTDTLRVPLFDFHAKWELDHAEDLLEEIERESMRVEELREHSKYSGKDRIFEKVELDAGGEEKVKSVSSHFEKSQSFSSHFQNL